MTAGRKIATEDKDWGTPPTYVNAVRECFGGTIHLDPCSNAFSVVNALHEYRLPEVDGLRASWNHPTIYVNPPYGLDRKRGTGIAAWLHRCNDAHGKYGSEVIALVPVATNTGHWKKYVWGHADAVAFLYDTRLKFLVRGKLHGKGAPMSCAAIYWGVHPKRFVTVFERFGAALDLRALKGRQLGHR
jgi:DNA N-6-adenine-methyltransferase (Dam)